MGIISKIYHWCNAAVWGKKQPCMIKYKSSEFLLKAFLRCFTSLYKAVRAALATKHLDLLNDALDIY